MKKLFNLIGITALLSLPAPAQVTPVTILPGKIAVFKAGDNTGVFNISKSKVQPCFVQVFDPAITNQSAPLNSIALPTNAPNGIWINAHAGSEGGGISLSVNRQFLALQGYTGNILSPKAAKPSTDITVTRGFGVMDAFGNEHIIYQDLANWFGLPPGTSQNNPTGLATTDGTNFWGTGNAAGTSSETSGTLFYNGTFAPYAGVPQELQNNIQAAAEVRIINGTLYTVVPGGTANVTAGVYNFTDPNNNNAVVPLPFDPDVPNPVEHVVQTNLYINWGTIFQNIANFDMDASNTVAYGADQTFGIVKFINVNGIWQQAPYYFSATNLGTLDQPAASQGCFGIAVDFSGTNPVIYATTMELGQPPHANNAQGNANQNRLIRIVDNGDPGTNLVAATLSTATSTNESFRGISFTPDLRPLITTTPVSVSKTVGGSASFTVAADSVYALNYQWQQNGSDLTGETSPTLNLNNLTLGMSGFSYQCIVSNQYGSVTSAPPAILTVSTLTLPPVITNSVAVLTNFVGNNQTFAAITPTGTQPFDFQWYQGTTKLTDDGVKYGGSTSPSLSISNLVAEDSGNYYLVAHNSAGTASNLVDTLSVLFQKPVISNGGQPQSAAAFVGGSATLTVTPSGGTQPLQPQWFHGTTQLQDAGEYSGTGDFTLTINPANPGDSGPYTVVLSNGGGSVTSQVATVTVLVPPAHSAVAYSNQIYVQNFDSLPDPGSNSVNSFNNPQVAGSVKGVAYSLANPFDFAFPVVNSSFVGGLGLSNNMPGWYGAADTLFPGVLGIIRFAAQNGDQTTGGVIDFGPNDSDAVRGTNRSLGLLSTGTTGSTTYALKLVNTSSDTLNYISLSFIGELWHNGTTHRDLSFGYTLDNTASSFVLSAQSISNSTLVPALGFNFQTNISVITTDGTQPQNQTNLAAANVALSSPWTPGSALWLIWSIDFNGAGSGNGYAIDNLVFYGSVSPVIQGTKPVLGGASFTTGSGASFTFTNTPGASFTVYATPSLTNPSWTLLGHPTETPNGATSTYSFTDGSASGIGNRFYKVTSP